MRAKKKPVKRRKILCAYDAWHFLREHPKLNRRERNAVEAADVERLRAEARKPKDFGGPIGKIRTRFRFTKDAGGNWWREWPDVMVPAVDENLHIHWATVDERGRVNKDDSKNIRTECWLELGEVKYGYHQPEFEAKEGARSYKMFYHDIDLDCGAPTFDEALIKLARKAQRKYGDYPTEDWQLFRPPPPRPRMMKRASNDGR